MFADPDAAGVATLSVETSDKDHGRLEIRTHTVCHDIDWLLSDRRYPGEIKFPGLAMIGMVESETERNGKIEWARRYYLCSKKLSAKTFADVVRPTGPSRTGCTGRSTSSSTRTNADCELAMALKTWPSSGTWR